MGARGPRKTRRSDTVKAEFDDMLRQASRNGWAPHCTNRTAVFVDYEEPPTPEVARALCAGCPMLALCKEYAKETKVAWGVWGGIAWEDGRQLPRQIKKEVYLELILEIA